MRNYNGELLHSASDLNSFLGCRHAVTLNLQKLRDPASLPDRAVDDETTKLVQDQGHAHEARFLDQLRSVTEVSEIATSPDLAACAADTIDAMRAGIPIIYQATFLTAPWHGFADFLRRVDTPSLLGSHSYEVIDTKLARTPSPKHVMQLALYSDMIEAVQGFAPRAMYLVLGDGKEVEFRRAEFHHTLRAAKTRYIDFVGKGEMKTRPEPCKSCQYCGWRDVCADQWKAEDHLSEVAGILSSQIKKLRDGGINTVAELAALGPDKHVPKLAPAILQKLRAQAQLQVDRRQGLPVVELLPVEPNRGFARMPQPHPADLFFDLEGDPLHPDGLEYLWGVHFRENGRDAAFRYAWGHDRIAERAAFELMVDWFVDHLKRNPGSHIYHYAAYEVTVLRRLSTAFASRENDVDWLLRHEKFVDLYSIARSAIRTSEPNLSLKTLEIFFAASREEDVTKADQSIVHYHRWRETGEQSLLDGILAYNKVDCENTEGLRDWLVSLRPAGPWWTKAEDTAENRSEALDERERRLTALAEAMRGRTDLFSARMCELAGHILNFHTRAKKPEQWAVYDRCERGEDELVDDGECIGDLTPASANWQRPDKRSTIATYRFPEQDTKLREGKNVLHAPTRVRMGKIHSLDRENGLVEVRRGAAAGPFPSSGSLIPDWPLKTDILEAAVERVVTAWASTPNPATDDRPPPYPALADFLERKRPRFKSLCDGALIPDGADLVEDTLACAADLDSSTLFVQGPPGTGKTHTSAQVILALLRAGKRIGVSSNSHKAINNLLAKIESFAAASGQRVDGAKKVTANDPETYLNGSMIVDVDSARDVEEGGYNLVGGTAWLFAAEEFDQHFDYLFVDEAGQVSLGHMIAMGAAAKNIVLIGDQMQLSQPIQGAHPGESGQSALDYLLEGAATIAPDRGILLNSSWRMHPAIGRFISEAVYDGRLRSHPHCERQQLLVDGSATDALPNFGIKMISMAHEGCRQRSDEEVQSVTQLLSSLIGTEFIDRNGDTGRIGLANILIVSPFNMQVQALKDRLPADARVGTVDKFQGQEAEVVIVSMATSSPDDLPRHVDFFYSKNRLNVAISRARTLAIVLANPRLLELEATQVDHLRLVNTMAWLAAEAVGGD